ncbi:MAG: zinc-dependent peptidase [Myxococcales bacterium]|nr:zinc-dependent peptidase [Myxococcales bacterium]
MFGWWKRRRAAREPFPPEWRAILEHDVPFYRDLDGEERELFEGKLLVFVRTKHFEGAGELEVTDQMRVVVAATAIRLSLHLEDEHYERLHDIVLYPAGVRIPSEGTAISGQAFGAGTVILSWADTLRDLQRRDGHNVGFHEFAHILDREDGAFDGTPRLATRAAYAPWAKHMARAYLALRDAKSRHGQVVSAYGATNEAEFFAEATVAFFEHSHELRERDPGLYAVLADFYRTDPAASPR